jgi:hypothetical protein
MEACDGIVHWAGAMAFSKRVALEEKASRLGVVRLEYP